jgi:hypothetical protein
MRITPSGTFFAFSCFLSGRSFDFEDILRVEVSEEMLLGLITPATGRHRQTGAFCVWAQAHAAVWLGGGVLSKAKAEKPAPL